MKLVHTAEIPEINVNHNAAIKKRVLIAKGTIPNLFTFASATFKPGDKVETHMHESAFEIFHVQKGNVDFVVNDEKLSLTVGDCITMEPGDFHSVENNSNEEVVLLYFLMASEDNL